MLHNHNVAHFFIFVFIIFLFFLLLLRSQYYIFFLLSILPCISSKTHILFLFSPVFSHLKIAFSKISNCLSYKYYKNYLFCIQLFSPVLLQLLLLLPLFILFIFLSHFIQLPLFVCRIFS